LIEETNALYKWDEYLRWFSNYCKTTSQIGWDFVKIIRKRDLGALDQRKAIILEIIEKYHLEEILSLENKFSVR
jgi:hypothetical protein